MNDMHFYLQVKKTQIRLIKYTLYYITRADPDYYIV
jgi:hypothetical protein